VKRRNRNAGITLIEVLIAVTLLSALTVAMLFSMRIGLNTFTKAGDKLRQYRRVAGAQRFLMQEIEGAIAVRAPCAAPPGMPGGIVSFFQGDEQTLRIVSTFSLQGGWRGQPQILEFAVIPAAEERGVRLIVNELPYTGPLSAGARCDSFVIDPVTMAARPHFLPIAAGPQSFVLADNLEFCRFRFFSQPQPNIPSAWAPEWLASEWPRAVRIEMGPLKPDPAQLQPISVTVPLRVLRSARVAYADN
jgi:type II secretory pathway component PulJ